ncbi:MAG: hypothetical protein HON76_07720 [Candidatus Scalindua sp.]|nr:hypothetical protein [Candidatus Scalindua sp.]
MKGIKNDVKKEWTFDRLKQLNTLMKEKEMEDLEKKLRYNSIVTNRDYPFCIFPEPMLHKLFTRIS